MFLMAVLAMLAFGQGFAVALPNDGGNGGGNKGCDGMNSDGFCEDNWADYRTWYDDQGQLCSESQGGYEYTEPCGDGSKSRCVIARYTTWSHAPVCD
jgi:hypothetical protein